MNNHWRHIRSERIQCSDLDSPWPDHITPMPLTEGQKRRLRKPYAACGTALKWIVPLAGLALLAFLYVRGAC